MMKSKIKTRPATCRETYWTGRIGTVHAGFQELTEKLGKPHNRTEEGKWKSRDNKTRYEWAFVVNGNKKLVFTIYDYKCTLPVDDIIQWSIGAKNKNAVFKKFLEEKGIKATIF